MTAITPASDGLDLTNLDSVTPDEVRRFREFYRQTKGTPLPAFDFLLDFRPDLLKRHRFATRQITAAENERWPLMHALAHLHYYVIIGFEEGIRYEIALSRSGGAALTDVLDTLGVAYLHGGPQGMARVASGSWDYLTQWRDNQEEPAAQRFPDDWSFDSDAIRSGMDFTSPEATEQDIAALTGWYESVIGYVPDQVRFLARHRPNLLKAFRGRYEHAIRDSLPKQMLPYLMLHLATCQRSAEAMREAVALGRAFGLTRSQLTDAICWGNQLGGPGAVALAEKTVGPALEEIPE
jgi:hypothetical protein